MSCTFGCLGRAEGNLPLRVNFLTDHFHSAPASPECAMLQGQPSISCQGHFIPGYQMGSIFGPAYHSILHCGTQSSSYAQIPAVTVVYFQPCLACTRNPGGEREMLGTGNIDAGVVSHVLGVCTDLYQVIQMVS